MTTLGLELLLQLKRGLGCFWIMTPWSSMFTVKWCSELGKTEWNVCRPSVWGTDLLTASILIKLYVCEWVCLLPFWSGLIKFDPLSCCEYTLFVYPPPILCPPAFVCHPRLCVHPIFASTPFVRLPCVSCSEHPPCAPFSSLNTGIPSFGGGIQWII